ncbi:hypothetical protein MRX96_053951 [Rhipicephalus microplus]
MKEAQELTGGRYRVLDSGDLQIDDLLRSKAKRSITQPPENYEVAADKSATFRCNAEADPSLELKIEWLFNGQPVDPEADARMVQAGDNSLTITRTIELPTLASTLALHALSSTAIVRRLPPHRPGTCPIHHRWSGSTATVSWLSWSGSQREIGELPILSYSIQYNTSFSPDTWEDAFVNIPAPDTKFKVSMSPWANYTFRVVARNKIGPSLPSGASSRCTTPEDVPHKNWTVSWVLWKRDDIPDATWSSRIIEDWKLNRHVEYGQPTFKPYRIKVEAHNRRGQAHTAATEVIGYSGENVPLAAPQDFKLANVVDARTANFTWSPVSPESVRGHFRGYKIQTWTPDEGEEKLREVVVPANVTTATYRITIHAATAQGQGDPNFIELETADESERVPDMPDFTWAYLPDRDGHAAVQVTWLPAMAGHPGSHFYVQYRTKG